MSTTITPVTTPAQIARPTTTTWMAVSEGLWAGTRGGEFLGTIEFVEGGFVTADHHGTPLGRSHSLAGAKRLADGRGPSESERVLLWSDERRVVVLGWVALAVSSVAAVTIASQFFV